jgi:hypothetical protein
VCNEHYLLFSRIFLFYFYPLLHIRKRVLPPRFRHDQKHRRTWRLTDVHFDLGRLEILRWRDFSVLMKAIFSSIFDLVQVLCGTATRQLVLILYNQISSVDNCICCIKRTWNAQLFDIVFFLMVPIFTTPHVSCCLRETS